jgi:hypothetical protein
MACRKTRGGIMAEEKESRNRVVSFAPPLKDNPLFRDAMKACNEAPKVFVPLRKQKKAVKK